MCGGGVSRPGWPVAGARSPGKAGQDSAALTHYSPSQITLNSSLFGDALLARRGMGVARLSTPTQASVRVWPVLVLFYSRLPLV